MGLQKMIDNELKKVVTGDGKNINDIYIEISNINSKVDVVNDKLDDINVSISETNNKLNNMNNNLSGKLDDINSNISSVNEKIDIANKKLDDIYYRVVPNFPIIVDFSKDWHKDLFNVEELGAEVVDLEEEVIPLQQPYLTKALKIPIGAGETKYLKLCFPGQMETQQIHILLYMTGDVKAEFYGAFTGHNVVNNVNDNWTWIVSRLNCWQPNAIKFTATNGGVVYIAFIAVSYNKDIITLHSFPNLSLDGTTTYTYILSLPVHGKDKGVARVYVKIAGDGVNPINVNVYVLSAVDNTYKLIASFSRTYSTLAIYQIKFAFKMFSEPPNDIQFINVKIEINGNGTFYQYGLTVWTYDELVLPFNGLKTSSASNASTTASTYTLIDNNGRGNRYKNAKIYINVPSTGGSAEILINGQTVATYSAGASDTFVIPDDIDVWKIEVTLAGDGTNPATADFEGLELLGPYIVRR